MTGEFTFGVRRVSRDEILGAIEQIQGHQPWLALLGGRGIGWATDEIPVILSPGRRLDGLEDATPLTPTVRPTNESPPRPRGVVALRWFEVETKDWEEFLDLSANAWPAFESAHDANILGLFRAPDTDVARALLATRYASLAEWERSRHAIAAESGEQAEAGKRFRRRQEITKKTIVRVAPPL
jgi:hypothetical protein